MVRAAMARNLLVLRFSSVGDVVRHHPPVSNVVGLTPGESAGSLLSRLQAYAPYDGVIDLHGKLRSRWISVRTRARRKVAWHKRPLRDTLLVPLRLRRYRAQMPIAARYHGAVERYAGTRLPREPLLYLAGDTAMRAAND